MSRLCESASVPESVIVEFALTSDEVARGFRAASFRSPRFLAVIALFALAAVAFVLGDVSEMAIILGVGVAIGIAFVVFVLPKRMVSRNPAMTAPQKVTISQTGFEQEASVGSAKLSWAAFRGLLETDGFFLLRQGTNIVIILPKRVFDHEQLQRVNSILQDAGLRNMQSSAKLGPK